MSLARDRERRRRQFSVLKKTRKVARILVLTTILAVAMGSPTILTVNAHYAWTKYGGNPVLDKGAPGSWDDRRVWDPSVLLEGSKGYKMWYTGASNLNPSKRQVGYATSSDGTSWSKQWGPVLGVGGSGAWDEVWAGNPSVVGGDGAYLMYYAGRNVAGVVQIGVAYSSDGSSWNRNPLNPILKPGPAAWDASWVHAPCVLYDPSWPSSQRWKMWYIGFDSGFAARIGYATSSDGVIWTKYASNPVVDLGPSGAWDSAGVGDPTVLFDGSTYHMWFMGDNGVSNRIGYATSTDGVAWNKFAGNPVVELGSSGSWDDAYAYGPTVLFKDGFYKMWYAGEGPYSRIGYAVYAVLSAAGSAVINAPAWNVFLIYPDYDPGHSPKDNGAKNAALSDFTAMGVIYGMTVNTQVETLDTSATHVTQSTGRPLLVEKAVVLVGGQAVHACVRYYENQRIAPVYPSVEGTMYYWYTRAGVKLASTAFDSTLFGNGISYHQDMFVVECFQDSDGNVVFVIYGYGWKGSFAGGRYFKSTIYPNISTYTHAYYIYQWIDANNDGFPDLNEITLVTSGD